MNENLRILSEMSEEELNNVLAQVSSLVKKMAHNDGQLTEEDLEQVVGGIGILGITAGVAAVGAVAYLVKSWFTGGQASYQAPHLIVSIDWDEPDCQRLDVSEERLDRTL